MSTIKPSETTYKIEDSYLKNKECHLLINNEEYIITISDYTEYLFYKGKEITLKDIELISSLAKEFAYKKYLSRILANKRYTIYEISNKLKKKFLLSKKDIDKLLDSYINSKILDDKAYAIDYIESNSHKYGRKRLLSELKKKGISENILNSQEILNSIDDTIDEEVIIKLEKRYRSLPFNKRCEKIKEILYKRGFITSEINKIKIIDTAKNDSSLLIKEAKKCYNAIASKKVDKEKMKSLFTTKLLRKGFSYEEIIKLKEEYFND